VDLWSGLCSDWASISSLCALARAVQRGLEPMPTKRTTINRQRTPTIDAETLALFVELNAVPMRRRDTDTFKQRDRALARRLDLGGEWMCDVCSVTDPSRKSYRTGFHHDAWLKVRAVRLRLLAMAGMSEPPARKRAS
jgi:hypothetical protein